MTFNMIQTNKKMMLEGMGTDEAIQELNSNEVDITKVPFCVLGWKLKIIILFLYEERAQASQHVPQKQFPKSLSEISC